MSPGQHRSRPAGNPSGLTSAGHGDDLASGYATRGVDAAIVGADWWWRDCAERALGWLAESGIVFDAYSLTELGVPTPDHPNRWGGLFAAAVKQETIEFVAYRHSRRPSRRNSVIATWRGTAGVRAHSPRGAL